jgi:hypothetical protein
MLRRLLLILSTGLLFSCTDDVETLIGRLGYAYDPAQDIYASKTSAWQRKAGYDSVIDQASVPAGMVIDCEPITFRHGGRDYMIELWKGQYDLSAGSEIGIYKRSDQGPFKWECGEGEDMLDLSYTLRKSGSPLFARSGLHWWLTGFKPGVFAEPAELVMDVTVDFARVPTMQPPFLAALGQVGYADVRVDGTKVLFVFDRPRTPQPHANADLVALTQAKNRRLVETYEGLKRKVGVTDNSPRSIEKLLKRSPIVLKELVKPRE